MQNPDKSELYKFTYHIQQITRLSLSGKTHEIDEYVATLSEPWQEKLTPWLQHVVLHNQQYDQPDQHISYIADVLPKAEQSRQAGWRCYFQHQYVQAFDHFAKALTEASWQQDATDTALGMAKVYTRTGHWQLAKSWCIYYLQLARKQLSHYDIAKGYGALAEVFLRAGRAKESLACFQLCYHLMPLGNAQQPRQYNFMASALSRNHENFRAQILLHTSKQLVSRVLDDPNKVSAKVSFYHSHMRLLYISLLQDDLADSQASQQSISAFLQENLSLYDDVLAEYTHILQNNASPALRVPIGMMLVAFAYAHWISKKHQTTELLGKAFVCFDNMPVEKIWVYRLYDAIRKQQEPVSASQQQTDVKHPFHQNNHDQLATQLTHFFDITQIQPPTYQSVFDKSWDDITLTNQGFADLSLADLSPKDTMHICYRFFI